MCFNSEYAKKEETNALRQLHPPSEQRTAPRALSFQAEPSPHQLPVRNTKCTPLNPLTTPKSTTCSFPLHCPYQARCCRFVLTYLKPFRSPASPVTAAPTRADTARNFVNLQHRQPCTHSLPRPLAPQSGSFHRSTRNFI